jgi:hypothetical protein
MVMAEHKEKLSKDYKILKKMKCKGETPQALSIKVSESDRPVDVTKHETSLQKEVKENVQEYR